MTQPTYEDNDIEIIDGMRIQVSTGEVLGLAQPLAFQINSPESLDWVMEKMLDEEAKMHEIDNTAIVVQARAILENAARMKSERAKRLAWLHARFDTEIGEYVRPLLEGQKAKTWKTLFGSVSFRTKPGGLRVLDEAEALRVAKLCYPGAVKTTEAFRISQLTDAEVIEITNGLLPSGWSETDGTRKAFAVIPESESITVKTSVTA